MDSMLIHAVRMKTGVKAPKFYPGNTYKPALQVLHITDFLYSIQFLLFKDSQSQLALP